MGVDNHPIPTPPMRGLGHWLHEMEQRLNREKWDMDYPNSIEVLFTSEVLSTPLRCKFKQPSIGTYNGSSHLLDHLDMFKDWMNLFAHGDAVN